jgi:hypothetical protein
MKLKDVISVKSEVIILKNLRSDKSCLYAHGRKTEQMR